FYESAYGTPAVQEVIYNSPAFVLLMSLLAINVMAAVVIRYPWKRKQTGFIITHAGIEILLLGCLISHRYSIDGRTSVQQGSSIESINSNDEYVSVQLPDTGGNVQTHFFPVELWRDAGYPSLLSFVAHGMGAVSQIDMPRWPAGHKLIWPLGVGAHLEVLDWMPAADFRDVVQPDNSGTPAVMVHIGGQMFNGAAMDDNVPLMADAEGHGMTQYQGLIDMALWKAQSQAEVDEFLHPPDPATLPADGQVVIILHGHRYALNVTPDDLGKPLPLPGIGQTATLNVDDQDGAEESIIVTLNGPAGSQRFDVSALAPYVLIRMSGNEILSHGAPGPGDPILRYYRPDAYFTPRAHGRLELLSGPDGNLYARIFNTRDAPDQKPIPPFKVQIGKQYPNAWLRFAMSISQYAASGSVEQQFYPANIDPSQMLSDGHLRVMKVALVVDGQRTETWLLRANGPEQIQTPRGTVQLMYDFPKIDLGFSMTLNHADQINNPMTDQAASYESDVTIDGSGSNDGPHHIVMNQPINVNGFVISQANFNDDGSVDYGFRRDPGWWIKYLGCAGIVGGIFTMFYMKAYFQKPAAVAIGATATPGKKPSPQTTPATARA
ncbi:MAG TPA: hypothetical protein VMD30_10290, partial [Tepidisphaeraceae bacterium]|nr:hypothetical protein [Tepidisphaeraceae bacterium]